MVECPQPRRSDTGFSELEGDLTGGDLWALVFDALPVRQGQETKIVWRMTGEGDVAMSATGPEGREAFPVWGPESHAGGSNWERPGDEWGSGWLFRNRAAGRSTLFAVVCTGP